MLVVCDGMCQVRGASSRGALRAGNRRHGPCTAPAQSLARAVEERVQLAQRGRRLLARGPRQLATRRQHQARM